MILCKAYLITCTSPVHIHIRVIAGFHYLHLYYDYFISDNLYLESSSGIFSDIIHKPKLTKELVKKYYKLENEVR